MTDTTEPNRYPLWCYDRGEDCDQERRYQGPFKTEAEALSCDLGDDGGRARRCRRVLGSESGYDDTDRVVEDLNDGSYWQNSGWADWENEFARLKPGAVEAFERWLDEFVEVDIYVCEGDEP